MRLPTDRSSIAKRRLRSVLRNSIAASDRMLEQKISDAGPGNKRVDPHILTPARQELVDSGEIVQIEQGGLPWFHLANADPDNLRRRLDELVALHERASDNNVTMRVGQALEIAVYRALSSQDTLTHFGAYTDLDEHDDARLYKKEEPPRLVSGRAIPGNRRLDFLVSRDNTLGGIEVKNIRQWIYPGREEIRQLLLKCCHLDVVPILIARRIHFSTFSVLNPCGVLVHQTYNQLYANADAALAADVRHKDLLGYHDVRVGNMPDARLTRFIHENLPDLLREARPKFDRFKDLLLGYAEGDHTYKSFAARVKRRSRGEPEDLPSFEAAEGAGDDDVE